MSEIARESVVVFGAGATGLRVVRELTSNGRCEVLAFADTSADRQGTMFEGLRIVAPEVIVMADIDRVVVASDDWQQITTRLTTLGFPSDRIQVHRPDVAA